MTLQFRRLHSTTVQEVITEGLLPELEYGLLKKDGDRLRWGTEEKALFCNMGVDVLECQQDHLKLKVIVRSFCYSRDVTTDYLSLDERFNMKRCVLIIGNNGCQPAPWAGLIQPAVYLHAHEFNVLCIEIPEYATNIQRWIKYGPSIMRGALRFLKVEQVHVLACGNGGAVFLEALGQTRKGMARTHFIYNIDCPPATRKAQFPIFDIEQNLREYEMQLWFGYHDEEDVWSRYVEGTPRKAFEAISGMQARLEGERKRGKRVQEYDEVIISETLNKHITNAERMVFGKNILFVFSDELLASIARVFEHAPYGKNEDLKEGLIADPNAVHKAAFKKIPVLPSLQAIADGSHPLLPPENMPILTLGRPWLALPPVAGDSTPQRSSKLLPAVADAQGDGQQQSPQRALVASASAPSLQRSKTDGSLVSKVEAAAVSFGLTPAQAAGFAKARRRKVMSQAVPSHVPPAEEYVKSREVMWDVLGED